MSADASENKRRAMNIVVMEDGLIYRFRCRHKVFKKIFRKEKRHTEERGRKRY